MGARGLSEGEEEGGVGGLAFEEGGGRGAGRRRGGSRLCAAQSGVERAGRRQNPRCPGPGGGRERGANVRPTPVTQGNRGAVSILPALDARPLAASPQLALAAGINGHFRVEETRRGEVACLKVAEGETQSLVSLIRGAPPHKCACWRH